MMHWTDAAAPDATSRTLGVRWSALKGKAIDAYLLWADLTAFQSIAREGTAGQPFDARTDALRIAAELDPAKPLPGGHSIRWHEILRTTTALYATTLVRTTELKTLLKDERVRRIELGFCAPASPPAGPASAASLLHKPAPTRRATLAVIDFGCAFAHERFRHVDSRGRWRSRIAYLWDQGRRPGAAAGDRWRAVDEPGYGRELRRTDIDALLAACPQAGGGIDEDAVYRRAHYDSVQAPLVHGTHVLDLAAGAEPRARLASAPEIIFVQLPDFAIEDTSGGSMVTHLLDAFRYIRDRTGEHAPLVINLSYGSMAGPHDGSTLVETVMDAAIEADMGAIGSTSLPTRYSTIVLPAGNSFEADGHAAMTLSASHPSHRLHWQVQADNPTDAFLEFWYPRSAAGQLRICVTPPGGPRQAITIDNAITLHREPGGEPIAAVIHRRVAASGRNDALALVALAPTRTRDGRRATAPAGVWTVEAELVNPSSVTAAIPVDAWIERDDPPIGSGAPPRQSFFLTGHLPLPANRMSPAGTIVNRAGTCNSIANGSRTVIVGGCTLDRNGFAGLAGYSSAGPTRNPSRAIWPDILAASEKSSALSGVLAAGTRSGIAVRMNGTSVAAPQVARKLVHDCLAGARNVAPGPVTYHVPPLVPTLLDPAVDEWRAGRGFLGVVPQP